MLVGRLHQLKDHLESVDGNFAPSEADRQLAVDIHMVLKEGYELKVSPITANRYAAAVRPEQARASEALTWITALLDNMAHELEYRHVFVLSEEETDNYRLAHELFGDVWQKFGSITDDITEAARCLALERYTASAFHSIRCLEAAIRAVSRCIGIADPIKGREQSWGFALGAIKSRIDVLWPTASDKYIGDGQLMESVYATLAGMKSPYRDATMHLQKKYSPQEAKYIIEMVKGIFARVGERMDENGEPKIVVP